MISVKNPARSRPLSRNVRRLMKMARESPANPEVKKIERELTAHGAGSGLLRYAGKHLYGGD